MHAGIDQNMQAAMEATLPGGVVGLPALANTSPLTRGLTEYA